MALLDPADATPEPKAFVTKAVAGAVVMSLLIAPPLIPFVDYLHHANTDVDDKSLTDLRIISQGLPQLLLPYVYGPIFSFSDPVAPWA